MLQCVQAVKTSVKSSNTIKRDKQALKLFNKWQEVARKSNITVIQDERELPESSSLISARAWRLSRWRAPAACA